MRDRNELVSLHRYTATQDDYGEEIQTWTEIGKEFARVIYGRGYERRAERRVAGQEQSSQVVTFEMDANPTTRSLLARDRIVYMGANWDIQTPPALDTPKRGLVAVEAERAA